MHPGRRVIVAYVAALAAAILAGWLARDLHPLAIVAVADVAATVIVFAFSVAHDNSSFYDAYWSLAPPPIIAFFAYAGALSPRFAIASALILIWAVRLTYNWWRRWEGLTHEDWRYVDLRRQTKGAYWLVSFFGLHLFPTVLVFAGCLPMWAVATTPAPLGLLDAAAVAVTAGAIAIEAIADRQLYAHVDAGRGAEILDSGLWRYSRHPNYFGELAFWWGLALFAFAASAPGYVYVGALAMTGLFVFISVPMVERRAVRRRGDAFRAYVRRTSMLVPWLPRR